MFTTEFLWKPAIAFEVDENLFDARSRRNIQRLQRSWAHRAIHVEPVTCLEPSDRCGQCSIVTRTRRFGLRKISLECQTLSQRNDIGTRVALLQRITKLEALPPIAICVLPIAFERFHQSRVASFGGNHLGKSGTEVIYTQCTPQCAVHVYRIRRHMPIGFHVAWIDTASEHVIGVCCE